MFFLIGGIQPKKVILERRAASCPACGHTDIHVERVDHYLSLFFIPLFRVKTGAPYPVCANCGFVPGAGESSSYHRPASDSEGKKCSRCGRSIPDESYSYCPYCGHRI